MQIYKHIYDYKYMYNHLPLQGAYATPLYIVQAGTVKLEFLKPLNLAVKLKF
jgi:hypothetical protein